MYFKAFSNSFCLIIAENAWVPPCFFSISIASAIKDLLFAQSETAQNYFSIDEALSRLLFMTQKRTNNRVFYYIYAIVKTSRTLSFWFVYDVASVWPFVLLLTTFAIERKLKIYTAWIITWLYKVHNNVIRQYSNLLYISLIISFLIGRKRTENFRNQRLWRRLALDYTMIMSRSRVIVVVYCLLWKPVGRRL